MPMCKQPEKVDGLSTWQAQSTVTSICPWNQDELQILVESKPSRVKPASRDCDHKMQFAKKMQTGMTVYDTMKFEMKVDYFHFLTF